MILTDQDRGVAVTTKINYHNINKPIAEPSIIATCEVTQWKSVLWSAESKSED